ncbi:MAG: acetoacetate decarboxylase family protein [Microbacterium sp.]
MTGERRIHLPNVVESVNHTFACRSRDGAVDLAPLSDLSTPRDVDSQLTTERFFVTFSAVVSNFNGVDFIRYNEVIVKIPVVVRGQPFVFPVRTYVDNELSLVRGHELGFNKYMAPVDVVEDGLVSFDGPGLQLRTEIDDDVTLDEEESYAAVGAAFVLGDGGRPVTLVTSDVTQLHASAWLRAAGGGTIGGHRFDVDGARTTEDRFTLHRVAAI